MHAAVCEEWAFACLNVFWLRRAVPPSVTDEFDWQAESFTAQPTYGMEIR